MNIKDFELSEQIKKLFSWLAARVKSRRNRAELGRLVLLSYQLGMRDRQSYLDNENYGDQKISDVVKYMETVINRAEDESE